jgi:hypothetical protein
MVVSWCETDRSVRNLSAAVARERSDPAVTAANRFYRISSLSPLVLMARSHPQGITTQRLRAKITSV